MLTKENLLTYVSKAPDSELRRLTLFLVQSLNENNLADLSPYFKMRMKFDPSQADKKSPSDVFKEAVKDKPDITADPNLSKEDIEKLKAEKLLEEIDDETQNIERTPVTRLVSIRDIIRSTKGGGR